MELTHAESGDQLKCWFKLGIGRCRSEVSPAVKGLGGSEYMDAL